MTARYFVDHPISADRVVLAEAEGHHLLHVMRAKVGDEVTLFDGSGAEFLARIVGTQKRAVELLVVSRHEVDRELPVRIVAAVALPKGDRQQWLTEKLVELGVAELIPLNTEHSVVQASDKAVERLTRTVIEASKQCGRNRLMRVAPPRTWQQLVADRSVADVRWVADPGGTSAWGAPAAGASVCFAVGPEGGLSSAEVALAVDQGWTSIGLGRRILRVETAALALASRLGVGSSPIE